MTAQTITESFRKLSPPEKIRLLRELWDEITDESARMPLSSRGASCSTNGYASTKTILMKSNPGTKSETTS